MEEEKLKDIQEKMKELHRDYGIDQRELGKILIIASTSLLIVSVHAALSFQSASESLQKTNQKLDRASGVIGSDSFQRALESLESLGNPSITRQVRTAASAFQTADQAISQLEETKKNMDRNFEIYQWLSLIAILGEVAGIGIIFI